MIENNEKLFLPAAPRGLWDNAMFTKAHKDCIDMMLMFDPKVLSREAIFKMFFAQGKSPGVVKNELRSFLASTNAEQYWMARKHQLEVWRGLVQAEIGEVVEGVEDDIPSNWQEDVKKIAIKKALAGNLDDSKASEIVLKEVLKTQDGDEKVKEPIRVLPETCSNCRYKYDFMNKVVDRGEELNLCQYCNARKSCPNIEDKNLYDIPEDIRKEFEACFFETAKRDAVKITEV